MNIDDINNLIIHHQRRLQKLKEQQAIKGINTPPEVLTEIEDIEAELEKLQAALKTAGPQDNEGQPSDDQKPSPQPAPDSGYDVFISYSQTDRPWVLAELLPRLEAGGIKACLDFRDFKPGIARPIQVQQAVENSRRMLLILTPDYLQSEWDEFGNLMLQTLDPASRQRRLIPLLKSPCLLPLRLQMLTPLDFVNPVSWDLAWKQLLTTLSAP